MTLRTKTENLRLDAAKRMDRREFFKKFCALSGTMIIPAGILTTGCSQDNAAAEINLPENPATSPTAFSKLAFANNIDTIFSVTHDVYGVIDLQLNQVADEILIPEAEQFSISLSGPVTPVLIEDSYEVYNDNLGDLSLYLQPGGVSNGLQHYVAVFSLLNT